jgi:transcriptional regulator with XRE-family HTH domain
MSEQPISTRIKAVRNFLGYSQKEIAQKLGCSYQAWQGYEAGNNLPGGKILSRLNILGISIDWLLTGLGVMQTKYLNSDSSLPLFIPLIDTHLKSGDLPFRDRVRVLEYIPFSKEHLNKLTNQSNINDIVMLEVKGDSMEPTIKNGELVVIDLHYAHVSGAIMALAYEDCIYVKRVHKFPGGIDIVSDNKSFYHRHQISDADFNPQCIFGHVRWVGKSL